MTQEEDTQTLPEGNIKFLQKKQAMLKAGVYEISIDHEIRIKEHQDAAEDSIHAAKKFAVRGERFHLNKADIHGIFPPENAQGDFSRCLPHIVLNTETLPWERSASDQGNNPPWLALLTFYEDELSRISINTAKLSDLNASDDWLDRDSGESGNEQCTILEVPEDLLAEIIPSVDDLDWLCHIRQVSNAGKEDSEQGQQSDYAVIIGNRLPQPNFQPSSQQHPEERKTTVHLVSLEAYYNARDAEEKKNRYDPVNGTIQLISLKDWNFTCTGESLDFVATMEQLSQGVLKSSAAEGDPLKEQIFSRGYALLRHQMRQGDKTISLYRGPLLPAPLPTEIKLPISCADEALRFYQDWGLFDVSYAAAWQLGRLLALQNREFSNALYQWKRDRRLKTLIEKEKRMSEQVFGAAMQTAKEESRPDDKADLFSGMNRWLADLKTLSGIPLHYLVADPETMLPKNSIRFFHLNRNWTQSLIDGALSLGRATTADLKLDEGSQQSIHIKTDQTARQLRKNPDPDLPAEDGAKSHAMITGILIRSDIIVNWPGLEVAAYSDIDAGSELALIRMQRLSDTVLLCLFEGELARIDVHPPAEGLHYSIKADATGIKVRNPLTGHNGEAVKIENFIVAKTNVLKMNYLANAVCAHFTEISQDNFTSAQFALAMISESNHVSFLKNSN